MAYWKYNSNSSQQTDAILFKEDLTLAEVLNLENVIQDAKNGNKKLLDFLLLPSILEELIDLITTEPSNELPDNEKYRHPYIACELLTTDVLIISRSIVENKHLLDKLFSFLDQEPPLNPLLASFFSRTVVSFFTRKAHQDWYLYQFICLKALEYMKEKEGFVKSLIKHIGTSAIMELILKIVKEAKNCEMQESVALWLHSEDLIGQLIDTLNPSVDPSCQCNAAQLLCDIGNEFNCEVQNPHKTNEILESTDAVKKLLDTILGAEFCETSLVGGISVLLMLLNKVKETVRTNGGMVFRSVDCQDKSITSNIDNSGETTGDSSLEAQNSNDIDSVSSPWLQVESIIVSAIIPYLKVLHQLLLQPPPKPSFQLTTGLINPPLGNTRLHISSLIALLIATHRPEFIKELVELDIFKTLLDLFRSHPWNNFYHTQLVNCISFAIHPIPSNLYETQENILIKHIFVDCEIMSFILKAWENNTNQQNCKKGRRQGYMGHLIRIATVINSALENNSTVEPMLNENFPEVLIEWRQFVEETLSPIIELYKVCLGGVHPLEAPNVNQNSAGDKYSEDYQNGIPKANVIYEERPENIYENSVAERLVFENLCKQKEASWSSFGRPDNNEDEEIDDDLEKEDDFNYPESDDTDDSDESESCMKDMDEISQIWQSQHMFKISDPCPPLDPGSEKERSDIYDLFPQKQEVPATDDTGWADFDSNFGPSAVSQFKSIEPMPNYEAEASQMDTESSSAIGDGLQNDLTYEPSGALMDRTFGPFEDTLEKGFSHIVILPTNSLFSVKTPGEDKEDNELDSLGVPSEKDSLSSDTSNKTSGTNLESAFGPTEVSGDVKKSFDDDDEESSCGPNCDKQIEQIEPKEQVSTVPLVSEEKVATMEPV